MDVVTITRISNEKNFDQSILNSSGKMIIKKEIVGLNEYQHQNDQYNLLTNNVKRDQFYEDLNKVKDRLEKTAPNMQQVIQMDMKRVNRNQVYERKLNRDLNGPRGLNWQYKQELQRLENDEREAICDLRHFKRDLARVSISCLINQQLSAHQNKDLSRPQTPHLSVISDSSSTTQTSPKTRLLRERFFSINTTRTTIDHFIPFPQQRLSTNQTNSMDEKFSWMSKQVNSKITSNCPYLQLHANSIHQQKREIEEKLKKFLL